MKRNKSDGTRYVRIKPKFNIGDKVRFADGTRYTEEYHGIFVVTNIGLASYNPTDGSYKCQYSLTQQDFNATLEFEADGSYCTGVCDFIADGYAWAIDDVLVPADGNNK